MNEKKKGGIIHDAIAIFAITLVAGLLLGLVYEVTKAPIETAKVEAKKASYKKVSPQAADFTENAELTKKLTEAKPEGCIFNEIVEAKDASGKNIGYAVLVTSKEGYGGEIQFSMGVDEKGTITGIEVISMSETAGLGANCTEDKFKDQYKGIEGYSVELVKGTKGKNQVSAISGATITSKAVTHAVNETLKFLKTIEG